MVGLSLLTFPETVGKATAVEPASDRGDMQTGLRALPPASADLMRVRVRVSRESSSFLKPAPV